MGYKKNLWVNYGRRGEIIEITIRDSSGEKIEMFKSNNTKDYQKVLRIIKEKYNYDYEPSIKPEESINEQKKKEQDNFLKVDEDFTW